MNQKIFWNVIGIYNQKTWIIQLIIMLFLIISFIFRNKKILYLQTQFLLGISNIFIGIVFEFYYGEAILQKFIVAPLFVLIGLLMILESNKNKNIGFENIHTSTIILLILTLLYPFISMCLGHRFPKMVLYIMPCPLICFSILICTAYKKTNKLLMILLILWGMTGIKSLFFNVWEDSILFLCGVYGIIYFYRMCNKKLSSQNSSAQAKSHSN